MKYIIIMLLQILPVSAQEKVDPDEVIDKVREKIKLVKDYQVDVKIRAEMEFIQVPEMNAHIYFKKPDKFKITSDDFAILPAHVNNFSPMTFLNQEFDAIYLRDEKWEDEEITVIRAVPREYDGIATVDLYINKNNYYIRKMEANSEMGKAIINMHYNSGARVPLPSFMMLEIEVKGSNLDMPEFKKKALKQFEGGVGKVKLYYNNYKVNKGIDDSIFVEEE